MPRSLVASLILGLLWERPALAEAPATVGAPATVEAPAAVDREQGRLLDTQATAMGVLGGWAAVSVGAGAGLWALGRTPFVRAVGVQQVAWGAIDGLIAGLSYRGILADRKRAEPPAHWQRERQKLRTILAINVALDAAYLAVGASLLALGKRDSVRGAGAGILPQGAFLLVFDGAFWLSL